MVRKWKGNPFLYVGISSNSTKTGLTTHSPPQTSHPPIWSYRICTTDRKPVSIHQTNNFLGRETEMGWQSLNFPHLHPSIRSRTLKVWVVSSSIPSKSNGWLVKDSFASSSSSWLGVACIFFLLTLLSPEYRQSSALQVNSEFFATYTWDGLQVGDLPPLIFLSRRLTHRQDKSGGISIQQSKVQKP